MKIPKTLFFMVQNPIPLIVHLTWWFFFAALGVVFDDPFVEGKWPHVSQIISPPSSFGNYVTAASIILDEIVDDNIWKNGFWIYVAMPPFFICYREARGNLKGTAKAHQVWMKWYRRQQEAIAAGNTVEASPTSSESMRVKSYFRKAQKTILSMIRNPKLFITHFLCWIIYFFCWIFTAFLLFLMTELPDIAEGVRTAGSFLLSSDVLYLAIFAAIFALISSYQETRGTVKGIAKVQQAWTEWSHKQQEAKTQETRFDMPPPLFDTAG
jgi:hypothetical protein